MCQLSRFSSAAGVRTSTSGAGSNWSGLLVHLVVRLGVDIIAGDPHQVAALGHIMAQSAGDIRIGRGQVHAKNHFVIGKRLVCQIAGQERCGANGPAARFARRQGVFQIKSIVKIRDFMTLGLDHGHGDVLIDFLGEKPAVVIFRAVFACQADFAAMQAAAFKRENKIVFHSSAGREIQFRTAGLLVAVDV